MERKYSTYVGRVPMSGGEEQGQMRHKGSIFKKRDGASSASDPKMAVQDRSRTRASSFSHDVFTWHKLSWSTHTRIISTS
jgi:hypothetical protein